MTETQEEIIRYRLERAREALKEARLLTAGGLWNASVNRLYYACFYAVSALLLGRDLSSTKHTGIRSLFNLHFVKTGEVSRELGAIYNDLFENRHKGDYMDFVHFEENQVRPWITQAEIFVDKIAALARATAEVESVVAEDDEPSGKAMADETAAEEGD